MMLKASKREAKGKDLRRKTTKSSETEDLTSNREAKRKKLRREATESNKIEKLTSDREAKGKGLRQKITKFSETEELTLNREAKGKGLRRKTTKSSETEKLTSHRKATEKCLRKTNKSTETEELTSHCNATEKYLRKTTKSSETEITSVLNKFNKSDIISNFIQNQSNKKQHASITKQNIIKEAINLLTEKFSDLDELILFLHLKHILKIKKKRNWTAFEIKEAKRLSNSYLASLTSDKISYSLLRYFTKYDIPCKVYIEKKSNECIWIVMYLGNEKPRRPVYMVAHTKSSSVFVTNMTKQNLEIFQKVIRKTFRGSDIEQLSLIQENADFFQKLNLQSIKKLQKTKSKENFQKELPAKKKSRLEKSDSSENDESLEDLPRKRKTPLQNSENFELPKIESLQYYVKSSAFHEEQRNNNLYSVCGIKFKGAHVLKGLKHLVDSGIADGPLPDYLIKEPRCGKTDFVMTMS